jgi:hypothetical protein
VLAIAILGVVMTQAFGHKLQDSLRGMNLPPDVLSDIQSNLVKLGGLEVPATSDPKTAAAIRADIALAFVFGFRLTMVICASLAVASAGVALRMIPSERRIVSRQAALA